VDQVQLEEAKREIIEGVLDKLTDRARVKVAVDIRPTKGFLAEFTP
jgi:hypothetical protein